MFCDHDWVPRTGMDSGSICMKCFKVSEKETDMSTTGGLETGKLEKTNKDKNISIFNRIRGIF